MISKNDRISAFYRLGEHLSTLSNTELGEWTTGAENENGWFKPHNVRQAIEGLVHMLSHDKLDQWTHSYRLDPEVPRIVGVVMAGNLPLVGFHDLLCVLLSGHFVAIKSSSSDTFLVKKIVTNLLEIEPRFNRNLDFRDQLKAIDAVIATGSDNSSRYFEYYFGKYPHIIRKNRTSVALLDGDESKNEMIALGNDIFDYYGLGCRNVSKLLVPKGYDFQRLLDSWQTHAQVAENHKYLNNYEYNKSLLLVNGIPHKDTGFSLLQESDQLVSPISVTYYSEYNRLTEIEAYLKQHSEKLQCIVGHTPFCDISFGKTQIPDPWDYADGVDTMNFLDQLR